MRRLWWAIKYASLTVKHKWFVSLAGRTMGVPLWPLVVHDFSKFSCVELFAYGRQFFGDKGDPEGFARAWLHHQNANPHHWEYWVSRSGHNRGKRDSLGYHCARALPMPATYVREMIADWLGASRAYTGSWDMDEWLSNNLWRMDLHRDTYALLQSLLPSIGCSFLLELPMRFWRSAPNGTEEKQR